jgi:RHS repeat-associated protein
VVVMAVVAVVVMAVVAVVVMAVVVMAKSERPMMAMKKVITVLQHAAMPRAASSVLWLLVALIALLAGNLPAEAQVGYSSGSFRAASAGPPKFPSQPNGKFTIGAEDLRIKVPGGDLLWTREYDGNQWKINARWSSLQAKFDEVAIGSSYAVALDGGGGGGAQIVPSSILGGGGSTPAEVFGGTGFPGAAGIVGGQQELGVGPLKSITRNGTVFYADSSRMVFAAANARYVIRPIFAPGFTGTREISYPGGVTATVSGVFQQDLVGAGGVTGFRWQDRSGDWIEYDRSGAVTRYGDRNDVTVSFEYETVGGTRRIRFVRDNTNVAVLELLYSSTQAHRIVEVREVAGTAAEPARRVQYEYNDNGCISRVIDVRGNSIRYEYDSARRLSALIDQENRTFSVQYGDTNRMSKTIAKDGGVTDYVYDYDKSRKEFFVRISYPETPAGRRVEERWYNNDGRLLRVTLNGNPVASLESDPKDLKKEIYKDARGNTTEYTRNTFDLVEQMRLEDGSTYQVNYDSSNLNVLSETDEEGVRTTYSYDSAGNLSGVVDAAGTADARNWTVVSDAAGNFTSWTVRGRAEANGSTSLDATESFEYDERHNLIRSTDAEGNVTRYEYNRRGDLTRVVEPRGGEWLLTYLPSGEQRTIRNAVNNTIEYEYDRVGNVVSYRDGRGNVSRWQYDAADRETASRDSYGAELRSVFDRDGNMTSQLDANGKGMRLEYDPSGRLTKGTDAKGFQYLMGYTDEDGVDKGLSFASSVRYPTFERRYRFDSRQRGTQKAEVTSSDSFVTNYALDRVGRQRSITDPNGKTRSLEYNALGQVRQMRDSLGNGVSFAYDSLGNLVRITDPRGNATLFTNDRRGLPVTETDPLGNVTRYTYDDNGALVEVRLGNGKRTTYAYDLGGRQTENRQYDQSNALIQTVTFGYDANDNVTSWSNGEQSAALTYDNEDRLTSETVSYGSISLAYAYTYYENGQVRTFTGPDNVAISYFYDAAGQLERVSIPGEGDIAVTEWSWTARKKVLLPGGASQEFEYDGLLDVTRLRVKSPAQQTLFELENRYGQMQEVTERRVDGAATQYTYDDALRLTGTQGDGTVTYTLDAAGNRVGATPVPGTWSYDAANQLTSKGAITYTYDAAGNLISKVNSAAAEPQRTTRYEYDSFSRLIAVRNGADQLVARYTYDPFDLRLSKEVFIGPNAGTTFYLHTETGPVAEATAAGVVTTSYGWHPEEAYGTYPLYARVPAVNSSGYRYVYYHNDHLGTPHRVTDTAGNVVWSASYDTFGNATLNGLPPASAALAITNNLRFAGQYYDAETGLHYNNRRYYENETGRYITRDPLGFEGGPNLYSYVRHNPVSYSDPTGEIIPCLLAGYLRCMVTCMALGKLGDWMSGCPTDLGDMALDCATDCLWSLIPLPNKCGKFGGVAGGVIGAAGAMNSFSGDTLVHTRSREGIPKLQPISQIKVGDEVLAWAEWMSGEAPTLHDIEQRAAANGDIKDAALRYESVGDVLTSVQQQTLVHVTLESGEVFTATAGHPVRTTAGWRDAALLASGDRLLVQVEGARVGDVAIAAVRQETKTLQVYNLEVEKLHTFFVGDDGILVHNGRSASIRRAWEKYYGRKWPKNPKNEKIRPGGNQDAHHKKKRCRGGSDHPRNIEPKTPSQHIRHHQKYGYK